MDRSRFSRLALITSSAFATLIAGGSGDGNDKAIEESPYPDRPRLLKIGQYFFNIASIRYVHIHQEGLLVVFGPHAEERVSLVGGDALLMREWLDGKPRNPHDELPDEKTKPRGTLPRIRLQRAVSVRRCAKLDSIILIFQMFNI